MTALYDGIMTISQFIVSIIYQNILTTNCLTECYLTNSMFCIRCYLNVVALYTALQLDVVAEQFRLTQTEGILSTDFF